MRFLDLGGKFLAEDKEIKFFSWDIDNKYYMAQVLLCTTEKLPLEISAEGIEAVILCYDPKVHKFLLRVLGILMDCFFGGFRRRRTVWKSMRHLFRG